MFNKIYQITDVSDYYFVRFPLSAALKQKIVEKIGNVLLPGNFEKPKYNREKLIIRGESLGWHIIDTQTLVRQLVETLSSDQKKLSPAGVWNDTLLKERLDERWNLDNWV